MSSKSSEDDGVGCFFMAIVTILLLIWTSTKDAEPEEGGAENGAGNAWSVPGEVNDAPVFEVKDSHGVGAQEAPVIPQH